MPKRFGLELKVMIINSVTLTPTTWLTAIKHKFLVFFEKKRALEFISDKNFKFSNNLKKSPLDAKTEAKRHKTKSEYANLNHFVQKKRKFFQNFQNFFQNFSEFFQIFLKCEIFKLPEVT